MQAVRGLTLARAFLSLLLQLMQLQAVATNGVLSAT